MDGYDPSTYGDAFADVYDDWYADVTDVDATVERLAGLAAEADGGPVLELGIGTGRIALPLAARGVRVWGIDSSLAMVEALRRKPGGDAIPVAIGDMSALPLRDTPGGAEARFSVVYATFNTLFNLTSPGAQLRCLTRAREVLAPSGRVVIEAFVPDENAPASGVEARQVERDRVVLSVSRRQANGPVVNGQHIEITESGIRLRPWVICYATPAQLDAIAANAGLRLQARWGDWSGAPFTDDSPVHISLYGAL